MQTVDFNALSSIGTVLVAIIGVCIAILQIRAAARDAHAARAADIAWQIYGAYIDPAIQNARGAAELISRVDPVPSTGEEYGQHYAQREMNERTKEEHLDRQMRRLLRFYNQVGILVHKRLIDDDLVFALIGPGLKSGWPGVKAAVDWYQNYYAGSSGIGKADARSIYVHIPLLYKRYLDWSTTEFQQPNDKGSRGIRRVFKRRRIIASPEAQLSSRVFDTTP
ncbi:MAG TPA: hypothetical protein VJ276_17950 [Thermoanaerobaculia bacterium]|nr:hypothetical protein [Thermoanaerobaculia bacterium]